MEDFLDGWIRKKDPEAYRKMRRRDAVMAVISVAIIVGVIVLALVALT